MQGDYSIQAQTLNQGPARDTLIENPYRFTLPAATNIIPIGEARPYSPLVAFDDKETGPVLLDPWVGTDYQPRPETQTPPVQTAVPETPPQLPAEGETGIVAWAKKNPVLALGIIALIGYGVYSTSKSGKK